MRMKINGSERPSLRYLVSHDVFNRVGVTAEFTREESPRVVVHHIVVHGILPKFRQHLPKSLATVDVAAVRGRFGRRFHVPPHGQRQKVVLEKGVHVSAANEKF